MKANYKKLLMILPFMPLMMANSPARRYIEKPNYDDFEITLVSKEATGSTSHGKEYYYTFHLNNTGEGYIYNIVYSDDNFQYDYWAIPYMEELDAYFYNMLLAPHHEYTFSFYYMDINFDNYRISSFAYIEFVPDEEIGGPKTISVIYESNYSTDICAEYIIKNENDYKYTYIAIINVNYDGVDYSIPTGGRLYYEDKEGFEISSSVRLDKTKLTFLENGCVIARMLNENYKEPTFNILALAIAVGSVILICGVFSAIYFPLKAKRGKNNEK